VVLTTVEFDPASNMFEMKVMNEPGRCHDDLVDMGSMASEAVFRQGTRLHNPTDGEDDQISSGDGAWIMQKCAKTLGGSCRISFERSRTIFTFCCPAEPLTAVDLPATEDFEVPPGTWGVAIDDSLIQRRLLTRILAHAGVDESKRIVIGKEPSDALKLGDLVRKILTDDESCKIMVIVDENLDFTQRDLTHVILSGSIIMKDILNSLTAQQESRTFALVRSANDSTDDVSMYLERVHAFFPKAPMQRERVREILAPLWADRFLSPKGKGEELVCGNEVNREVPAANEIVLKEELLESVSQVSKLLDSDQQKVSWPRLWSALHSLKGDLMVVENSKDLELAIMLIASMKGLNEPPELHSKWTVIRELVMKAIEAQ